MKKSKLRLIYCSFPLLGYTSDDPEPTWVASLPDHLSKRYVVYSPANPLSFLRRSEAIQLLGSEQVTRLPSLLCSTKAQDIVDGDTSILRKSHVIIVDNERPSYGGTPQELLLAYQQGIPIILVCSRHTMAPWMVARSTVIVPQPNAEILASIVTGLIG